MAMAAGIGGGRMAFRAVADNVMMEAAAAPAPMASPNDMKKPERVRKLFPETWLWQNKNTM